MIDQVGLGHREIQSTGLVDQIYLGHPVAPKKISFRVITRLSLQVPRPKILCKVKSFNNSLSLHIAYIKM